MVINKIKDSNEDENSSIRKKLSLLLYDKNNPEMITNLHHSEIDNFTNLLVLTEKENEIRDTYNLEENFLGDILLKNLVLRCSKDGKRAEQGVQIITSNLSEESLDKNPFSKLQNKLI